jgi:hypothetical protein
LIQQLEKYLLKALQRKQSGKQVSSPLGSLQVFDNMEKVVTLLQNFSKNFQLGEKCDFTSPSQFLNFGYLPALQWRFLTLISDGAKKLMSNVTQKDAFNAFNDSQVFYLQAAAKAFMENLLIKNLFQITENLPAEFHSLKPVLVVTIFFFT